MDFSAGSLFLSLVIGAVGAGFFLYGKKQGRLPQLVGGIILSLYPYWISNLWVMGGIAVGVVAAIFIAVRAGL